MPKRTNTFQQVVTIIHQHLAGNTSVEESAELLNSATGKLREVDVVLRAQVGAYETVIGIEATSGGRRATVEWVERMAAKHRHLPTDKVVLVAEAGFTKQARKLAVAERLVPLAPDDLSGEDPTFTIVNALPSLWPKTVSLSPQGARVWVTRPDGNEVWFKAPADLDLVTEDEAITVDLASFYRTTYMQNWRAMTEQMGLADVSADVESEFVFQIGPPVTIEIDGVQRHMFARWVESDVPELHRVERIVLHGKAAIEMREIKLHHKRLGDIDVRYAYGEGDIGGSRALVVATENEHGGKLTVRVDNEAIER